MFIKYTDINECASGPCQNGATCNDLLNRYECNCAPGFNGTNCEISQFAFYKLFSESFLILTL